MLAAMDLSTLVALVVVALLAGAGGYAAGLAAGVLRGRSDPERADEHAVVRERLDRLHDQLRDLEHSRVSWQGQLHQQVADVRLTAEGLRRETRALSTALRKPQVRGRWGELHLRRTVELAGLVDHCDFTEQAQLADGARRPDLVVHLAGGRRVVVDAKVPLDAYLDATDATDADDEQHEAHLARHARQLRTHVDGLASKAYWRSLEGTPEFVVCFVPAESFLAAALGADPGLLEHAAARQVVLATPSTLIALLRTVSHGWRHEAVAAQAQEIHRLGRDLHERLGTWTRHLDNLGRSLNTAVGHYNSAVGSLESRVLVQGRRFRDLAVTDDELPAPRTVELRAIGGAIEEGPDRRADDDDPPRARTVGL
jgi:DNA recombination protein RmuC